MRLEHEQKSGVLFADFIHSVTLIQRIKSFNSSNQPKSFFGLHLKEGGAKGKEGSSMQGKIDRNRVILIQTSQEV